MATKKRTDVVAFRASEADRRWLETTAENMERSVSWVLRRLIKDARRSLVWPPSNLQEVKP